MREVKVTGTLFERGKRRKKTMTTQEEIIRD
jgi:hypothetical protein